MSKSDPANARLTPMAFMNVCGSCNACCIAPVVSAVQKPAGQPCQHLRLGKQGCMIYKDRPECCKTYSCLWLTGAFGGEDQRPDKSGLLFELHGTPFGKMIVVRELRPGILKDLHPIFSHSYLAIDSDNIGQLILPHGTTPAQEENLRKGIEYLSQIA